MKIKSVLASAAACAIAVSAMAVSASAKVLNPADGDDKYLYEIVTETANNLPEGKTLADVYGFSFKVDKLAGEGETCVGAFAWQSDSVNWEQEEFCQEGGDKNIFIGSDGTVKLLKDSALFAAGDTWAKAFVAEWSWDGDAQIDFTVSDFTLLGQDGNALSGASFTIEGDSINKVVKNVETFEEASDGTYYKLKTGAYTTEAPQTEAPTAD